PPFPTRRSSDLGDYRNEWKNDDDNTPWRDYESIQTGSFRCGQYRKSVYAGSIEDDTGQCDSCGNQQFPAGDDPPVCSENQRDPEYHTGSSEPSPYNGKLHQGQRGNYRTSDKRRVLCTEL